MNRTSSGRIALLTGGDDRPYALGMASALCGEGYVVDFIGSDSLVSPELESYPNLRFLNLRGSQDESSPTLQKIVRIIRYYCRLIRYALQSKAGIFHILWNNRFEHFDRTVLCLFYRLTGKRIVLTAHNINRRKRDGSDNWLNRLTLRLQYSLCSHVLVHTSLMKAELIADFGVSNARVSEIPFGINATNPSTSLTRSEARTRLGVPQSARTLLAFGQIAPYKGIDLLVEALRLAQQKGGPLLLLIAGRVKRGSEAYWEAVSRQIAAAGLSDSVQIHAEFISDEKVEVYFKAADALVLSYTSIFQSGLPFLSYRFGLPVIATDVGAFRDVVREEETGFISPPKDPVALAATICRFFKSSLYRDRISHAEKIARWANEQNSWTRVGQILSGVYQEVLREGASGA